MEYNGKRIESNVTEQTPTPVAPNDEPVWSDATGTDLTDATLSGVFASVDFRGADLTEATLSGTFYGCHFCLSRQA
jgi:hypothetical protein